MLTVPRKLTHPQEHLLVIPSKAKVLVRYLDIIVPQRIPCTCMYIRLLPYFLC